MRNTGPVQLIGTSQAITDLKAEVERVSTDIVPLIFRQNISKGKGMGLTAMVQSVQALARQAREKRA